MSGPPTVLDETGVQRLVTEAELLDLLTDKHCQGHAAIKISGFLIKLFLSKATHEHVTHFRTLFTDLAKLGKMDVSDLGKLIERLARKLRYLIALGALLSGPHSLLREALF